MLAVKLNGVDDEGEEADPDADAGPDAVEDAEEDDDGGCCLSLFR